MSPLDNTRIRTGPLDPDQVEPAHISLIASLVACHPASADHTHRGFIAFGRPVTPIKASPKRSPAWLWTPVDDAADPLPSGSIAAKIARLTLPPGHTAVGVVSRATARQPDAPRAPGVPVIVAYAITRDTGSVSLLAYPDGQAIWSTSPSGALSEAAASLL